jgi:hypothetical protein
MNLLMLFLMMILEVHRDLHPLILLVPKYFERVVVDTYVYHKYCRSPLY